MMPSQGAAEALCRPMASMLLPLTAHAAMVVCVAAALRLTEDADAPWGRWLLYAEDGRGSAGEVALVRACVGRERAGSAGPDVCADAG